jgi:hypothetical protein
MRASFQGAAQERRHLECHAHHGGRWRQCVQLPAWQARRLLDLLIDGLKYRCDSK